MSSTGCLEDQQRALLAEVGEVEHLKAQLFAREMRLRARMDALWNSSERAQEQFGVLELAGTARISQTRAATQLLNGTRLVEDLPGTLTALESGLMFRESAVLLLELTRTCTPQVVRELERRVLPSILTANTTDVRRIVLALIPEVEADLDPELTEQRLAEAKARRSVWLTDRGEGMLEVTGSMDTISGKRWALDFEELVRSQKLADDKAGIIRSADQRRADVFTQLPSRMLALLQAIQRGETQQLLELALEDPDLADHVEALAATLPFDVHPTEDETPAEDPEPEMDLDGWRTERDWCSAVLPNDLIDGLRDDLIDDVPLPPEPPPDPADEPEPPDPAVIRHWTELSLRELAATVMGLPVRNPLLLNLHVPMSTLLQLDNRTGRIDQGGAVPASVLRLLAPSADLRRVLVDPDSHLPIGIDPTIHRAKPSTRSGKAAPRVSTLRDRLEPLLEPFLLREHAQPQHDPSNRLRQLIELRDQRCTGIGCSQPASRCHLDHETAYPQGPTAAWNLTAKSARCHRAKHAGWTATRHTTQADRPDAADAPTGSTTWTSPLGHSYTRLSTWTHPTKRPRLQLIQPRTNLTVEIDVQQRHAA
jgi:hypothetical protein